MAALPYVTAPGNIDRALRGIKSAATPERVSQDFVKTILKIRGGSGNQMAAFLRKVGFVNQDGTPSDVYKKFRNPSTSGNAAAEALKIGYGPLYARNEYMHQLSDAELRGLIIEETGQKEDSSVVALVLASINAIKKFVEKSKAGTDASQEPTPEKMDREAEVTHAKKRATGQPLGFSYTINLNLPLTSDVAVFNAIFKSLKENLLGGPDEE
jgi:uncharacterized protein DUF5343